MVLQSGEVDDFGHVRLGGIGDAIAGKIRQRTGFDTRVTVLGYVQRGGTPTAFDRVLATRFGIAAIDAVHDRAFGQMVALRDGKIIRVPLAEAVGSLKTVDPDLLAVAEIFYG
jgi:6-phosphofructokinase 1